MMPRLIIYITLFLMITDVYGVEDKIWDNWYFGRRAGLTFDTPSKMPDPLRDGQLNTLEGCASISDNNGNLLFYTNGVIVYNKRHEIMLNGTFLKGHNSSTQSALILKKPGAGNIYYIFTTDKGPYEGKSDHELCYSMVDMDLEDGLGAVTVKNMVLHSPVVEKLTAVQHANKTDFWILARGMNNNKFIIVRLAEGGIVSNETFELGPIYQPFPASPEFSLGQLKANPKGDILATVVYGANNIELYRFNNSTGQIFNYLGITVDEPVTALYGMEFSPNNKFLYVNNLFGRIYQYDVSEYDNQKISKSMKIVFDSLDYSFQTFGQMQLAPNGRIYMALSYDTMLAVVDKPNVPAPFCRFNRQGQGLGGALSLFGLPNNVMTGIYPSLDIYGRDICIGKGDSLELFAIAYPEDPKYVYQWTGPNGFTSNLVNPKIPNAGFENSGLYRCSVTNDGKLFRTDSTYINVYEYPKSEIAGPKTICPPEIIKLTSRHQAPEYIYQWSNGEKTSEILVNSPGRYYLYITNPAGCNSDTSYIDVVNADNLSVIFNENKSFCKGETVEISVATQHYNPVRDYKFLWSTGDSTTSIKVNQEGYYRLTVTRIGGCSGTDSIYVRGLDVPTVELNHKDTVELCQGEEITIEPLEINPEWNYLWSDGFPEINRPITTTGMYKMLVSNQGLCFDSAQVFVKLSPNPIAEITFDNSLTLCSGDSVTLKSKFTNSSYKYLWSDGTEKPEIVVKESGKYKLKIISLVGCSDSTEIDVVVSPPVNVEINRTKTYLCLDDSVTLSANTRYASYRWSTGDTNDFIKVFKAGVYKLVVTNQYGCIDSTEIEITDINISAVFSKNELRIDSICTGETRTDSLDIVYNSDFDIVFSDFEFLGDNFFFDLDQKVEKISDGYYVHKITFTNGENKPGIYRGDILVTITEPCYSQFIVPVYLKVYSEFSFSAPDITEDIGNEICIKIDVMSQCENSDFHTYSPEFSIEMVPEHFYPKSVNGGILLDNINNFDVRIIKLKMDEQSFPAGVKRFIEVCGTVLVGKKSPSPIDIKDIDWKNNFINNVVKNGSLSVDGCVQDISGLQMFQPISVTVSPNPVTGNALITINSQERGIHIAEIYSIDGKKVSSFELDNFSEQNSQTIFIETNRLQQGIYQLIIRSPWNILRERIVVIRD